MTCPAKVSIAANSIYYHASFDRDLEINASGLGGYRLVGPRSATARVEEIVVRTLAIDVMDAHTKNIV